MMADKDGSEQSANCVGFLYETMRQRQGTHKRRVKPVDAALLQTHFAGLQDSSDDSDYQIADADSVSDDSNVSDDSAHSSEDDSDSSTSSDEDSEGDACEGLSVKDLLTKADSGAKLNNESLNGGVPAKNIRVIICCVCLGDTSGGEDEIVECDGCGVSVHEGCYGISDSLSVASTASSASTEPWFCDACKANINPTCELCPNSGGIFKETEASRWVHLVCALYTPGVAFGDVEMLSHVTLFEMPYSKWGAKECILCDDARFSRTGVCIACDAGMCRSYFHVTCAQKQGLLSEAPPEEMMDIADPFYAYCKQHAEQHKSRLRKRNWLALQSYWKSRSSELKAALEKPNTYEKQRVKRKLERHRKKYKLRTKPPCWEPKEKLPRMMTTSASALRQLMRKAELLGVSTQSEHLTNKVDIRKKWHVAPAFNIEYISYYYDRDVRMKDMKSHLEDLLAQRDKLREQERIQRVQYDKLHEALGRDKEIHKQMRTETEQLWKILNTFAGKKLPVPNVLKPKRVAKSSKKAHDSQIMSPHVIRSCGICQKSTDQHLLVKCDKCHKHLHLGCLDPPLTRMPKKTKQVGWMCSECMESSSDESETEMIKAPRRLRENIKGPLKFTPIGDDFKTVIRERKKKPIKRKRQVKRPKFHDELEDIKPLSPPKKEPTKQKNVQKDKVVESSECFECKAIDSDNVMVSCDECNLKYHFGCLDPPLKKTPKVRGYGWMCTRCDPASDSDSHVRNKVDDKSAGLEGKDHVSTEPPAALSILSSVCDISETLVANDSDARKASNKLSSPVKSSDLPAKSDDDSKASCHGRSHVSLLKTSPVKGMNSKNFSTDSGRVHVVKVASPASGGQAMKTVVVVEEPDQPPSYVQQDSSPCKSDSPQIDMVLDTVDDRYMDMDAFQEEDGVISLL